VSELRYLLSYRSSLSQIGAIFKNLFNASQFLDLDYQQPWEPLQELQVHYRDYRQYRIVDRSCDISHQVECHPLLWSVYLFGFQDYLEGRILHHLAECLEEYLMS
jgi:hypothetical protein